MRIHEKHDDFQDENISLSPEKKHDFYHNKSFDARTFLKGSERCGRIVPCLSKKETKTLKEDLKDNFTESIDVKEDKNWRKKRNRSAFSQSQVWYLEQLFAFKRYPNHQEKNFIANFLELSGERFVNFQKLEYNCFFMFQQKCK